MTLEELRNLVKCGREMEFEYKGKQYSITYGRFDGEYLISFCEFYQETTDVKTADELWQVKRDGVTVGEMLSALPEGEIWLF